MERTTLGTKLSAIEKKLGGTGEMPPAGTYDPLLWHLDRIESLIGGGSGETTWSPYTLDYTFDEIYTAAENQDEEVLSAVKDTIREIVEYTKFNNDNAAEYFEFNTKDGHVFKLTLVIGGNAAKAFNGNKEIDVQIHYEVDAETADARADIQYIEAREVVL